MFGDLQNGTVKGTISCSICGLIGARFKDAILPSWSFLDMMVNGRIIRSHSYCPKCQINYDVNIEFKTKLKKNEDRLVTGDN